MIFTKKINLKLAIIGITFMGLLIITNSVLMEFGLQKSVEFTYSTHYEETEKILNNKFNNKMFVMEQKCYKIIQKNVKMKKTMDSYALCGKITYNKPIGKVSYIDVKKIEEETVSINERN